VTRPGIAVFGSSEPRPGDREYDWAYEVGARLAAAGYTVVTGAYGGVMEGASRGAVEAGGCTLGVACELFGDRSPNAWLTERIFAPDLHDRTRLLVDRAQGFLVLPGKAGTLAELALLWALDRAGRLGGRPVVLLGAAFRPLVDLLARSGMLEPAQLQATRLADTPAEAVQAVLGSERR
jgi:uncharacterized protein (TIGR00730 family)